LKTLNSCEILEPFWRAFFWVIYWIYILGFNFCFIYCYNYAFVCVAVKIKTRFNVVFTFVNYCNILLILNSKIWLLLIFRFNIIYNSIFTNNGYVIHILYNIQSFSLLPFEYTGSSISIFETLYSLILHSIIDK